MTDLTVCAADCLSVCLSVCYVALINVVTTKTTWRQQGGLSSTSERVHCTDILEYHSAYVCGGEWIASCDRDSGDSSSVAKAGREMEDVLWSHASCKRV